MAAAEGASIEPPPLPLSPGMLTHLPPLPLGKSNAAALLRGGGQSVITDSEGSCSQLSAKLCTPELSFSLSLSFLLFVINILSIDT